MKRLARARYSEVLHPSVRARRRRRRSVGPLRRGKTIVRENQGCPTSGASSNRRQPTRRFRAPSRAPSPRRLWYPFRARLSMDLVFATCPHTRTSARFETLSPAPVTAAFAGPAAGKQLGWTPCLNVPSQIPGHVPGHAEHSRTRHRAVAVPPTPVSTVRPRVCTECCTERLGFGWLGGHLSRTLDAADCFWV